MPGHFLPSQDADRLLTVLEDFVKTTPPAHVPEERWRQLLTSARPDDAEKYEHTHRCW